MKKKNLILAILLVGSICWAQEGKNKKEQIVKPRIEKLGEILFLEIIVDNKDNIPKELLPDVRYKRGVVYFFPGQIRYNEKEKKVVYVEPAHFTTLLRKEKKYTYKALIKRVFTGAGPKRDGTYTDSVACFDLPKKVGNIEIVSYKKNGEVKINYSGLQKSINLRPGESWSSEVETSKIKDIIKFLGFNDAKEMAEQRRMDISLINQLTSGKEFYVSTQTKITNYGIVNLEVEIY